MNKLKYEYGVAYETNGENPELPDDVLVRTQHNDGEWLDIGPVSHWDWPEIKKFLIMDERYKPKPNDWHERGELPRLGSIWTHKNGNLYTVTDYANEYSTNDKYPVTIIYQGENGRVWCRPLSDWSRSMTPRTERDKLVDKAISAIRYSDDEPLSHKGIAEALIDAGWRPVKQQVEDEFVVGVMRVIGPLSDDEIHPRQYLMDCLRELHRAGKCFVEAGDE